MTLCCLFRPFLLSQVILLVKTLLPPVACWDDTVFYCIGLKLVLSFTSSPALWVQSHCHLQKAPTPPSSCSSINPRTLCPWEYLSGFSAGYRVASNRIKDQPTPSNNIRLMGTFHWEITDCSEALPTAMSSMQCLLGREGSKHVCFHQYKSLLRERACHPSAETGLPWVQDQSRKSLSQKDRDGETLR